MRELKFLVHLIYIIYCLLVFAHYKKFRQKALLFHTPCCCFEVIWWHVFDKQHFKQFQCLMVWISVIILIDWPTSKKYHHTAAEYTAVINKLFLSIIKSSSVLQNIIIILIEKNIMGIPLRSTLDLNLKGSE